ncbi:hypothetical protein ACOI1H_21160 [Loktanella sp. DJP18]|uniref:hypothetical protein n=1 Tax=Loktanella sp. DJP18 TaxID=3409788 RepID=UPI003BB72F00
MIIPTVSNIFRTPDPRPETPMEKTTREVKERLDAETEKRQVKVAGLRKARLEKEAHASGDAAASKAKVPRRVKNKS